MRCSFAEERCCRSPLPYSHHTRWRSTARSTGQGSRYLRIRRSPAHRGHRSHLRVRLRARLRHSRQGQGPHPDLGVLVRAHAADRPEPPDLDRRRRRFPGHARATADVLQRPLDARDADRAVADRMRRSRRTCRLGLEGLSWQPARCAASAAGRTARIGPAAHSRSSRRPPRRRAGTTSTSARPAAAALSASELLDRVRDLTLRLYAEGAAHAESCGIIVADTKFEFGLLAAATKPSARGRVILIDEVLTPDSSRFWPKDTYQPGGAQPSFDKQFVRDYLERFAGTSSPGALAPRRCDRRRRARNTSRRSAASPGRELAVVIAERLETPRRRDGGQRRAVRRRGPRVRKAVHLARPAASATAA